MKVALRPTRPSVPESAEVSSCGLRNISRVAVHCIQRRAGDGRTIYHNNTSDMQGLFGASLSSQRMFSVFVELILKLSFAVSPLSAFELMSQICIDSDLNFGLAMLYFSR